MSDDRDTLYESLRAAALAGGRYPAIPRPSK